VAARLDRRTVPALADAHCDGLHQLRRLGKRRHERRLERRLLDRRGEEAARAVRRAGVVPQSTRVRPRVAVEGARQLQRIRAERPNFVLSNSNEDTPIMDTISNEQKTGMTPSYDYPQASTPPRRG
jgi:hypothetical protein